MSQLPAPYKMEMIIKKQVTIAAGATTTTSITIPNDTDAALKGYGYSYYATNTYQLSADQIRFPDRTDQEGSASIPRIFEQSIPIKPGAAASLTITNGDSAEHTYDVVFYFYLSKMLPNVAAYQSSGGELIISTGGSSGTAQNIVVYNASLTTAANVTALGLDVNSKSPTTLLSGTKTAAAAGSALASSTACKKVTIGTKTTAVADADGYAIYIGNATSQDFPLFAGQSIDIEVANLATIFVKRAGASDVTVYYVGS